MIQYPNGWCRVVTVSGADGGLAFHCEKCHLVYPHDAPIEVFHCGALQKLEKSWWERLPKVTLQRPGSIFLE
jgi:hypothetical protein